MSTKENRRVILSLTVGEARRISDVLYQAESSAWFIDAHNQSNKRRGIPTIPARSGEDYSEVIKEAREVKDLFMAAYARGVCATCDITPFDDIFGRRPTYSDYFMYAGDDEEEDAALDASLGAVVEA